MEEMVLKKNEIDDALNFEPDFSEYKEYPGSVLGAYPEDDP